MFKVRTDHFVVLCGLMVLITGSAAARPIGHRAQVPLGDLMCRLEKVNQMDAESSSQTRNIDCVYQPPRDGIRRILHRNFEYYRFEYTGKGQRRACVGRPGSSEL